MLKLKYLFENYELARECLVNYEYEESSLDKMLRHFRISSNAIYPFFEVGDGRRMCFLRLSPIEEKPTSEVESEIRLIQWLRDKGCHVMQPVAMKNGKLSDVVDTKWGSYNVSCFAKVPGTDLEETEGTMELVRGYGACLGRFHKMVKEYPACEERRSHIGLLVEIKSRLQTLGAPEHVLMEWEHVRDELSLLPRDKDVYGMVHYDFEPDNVLYDAETGEFHIIDLDDAMQCWYVLDVARAMDALDDVVEEDEVEEAQKVFVKGYQKEYAFTEQDAARLPLMRRLVRLQEVSTLRYVLSEPVDETPEWLTQLIKKLQWKRNMLENRMMS